MKIHSEFPNAVPSIGGKCSSDDLPRSAASIIIGNGIASLAVKSDGLLSSGRQNPSKGNAS